MSVTHTLLNYLKSVEGRVGSPGYLPHPLMKALMLALDSARKGEKNGNYMGVSGDGDLTPDKKPHVMIVVVVEKLGDKITVLDVSDATTSRKISSTKVEKVLRSETLLDGFEGQEVPTELVADAMTEALGRGVYVLEDTAEIAKAVGRAQQLIREGKFVGLSISVRNEILNVKGATGWENLSSETRSSVGGMWAKEVGSSLVLTPIEPTVPKWRVRELILKLLEQA